MKTMTKPSKRIFSLFLAVLCTFGVFFVFNIPIFAESYNITISISLPYNSSSYSNSGSLYYVNMSGVSRSSSFIFNGTVATASVVDFDPNHSLHFNIKYSGTNVFGNSFSGYLNASNVGGVSLTTSSSSAPHFNFNTNPFTLTITGTSTGSGNATYYMYFWLDPDFATPTPEPTPTPTPTPTPDPGGSIPTPSGDYGSFFQRMASDAQSAFNALYLSWTNANNRFYSSIFFIGLPLLITVFGIVAGIILGDDD